MLEQNRRVEDQSPQFTLINIIVRFKMHDLLVSPVSLETTPILGRIVIPSPTLEIVFLLP